MLAAPNPPHLLDVREPEEFELVSLPHAKLLPLGQIPARYSELAEWKNAPVVVYCHHGIRSQHAIHFLRELGFGQLVNLSGGIDAWSREVDRAMPRY